MSVLTEKLNALSLPELWDGQMPWNIRREQIRDMLLQQEYGIIPPIAYTMEVSPLPAPSFIAGGKDSLAGKGTLCAYTMTLHLPHGDFSFPFASMIPNTAGRHPFFVLINFRDSIPDRYYPAEEICDRGYAVVSMYYNDITKDAPDDYTEGLAALLRASARDAGISEKMLPQKIAVWAWAMSRVMDWCVAQPELDAEHAAAIGHSRLGKTALVCGMLDERFACTISNCSGCSGAAISRGKVGEHIEDIVRVFPYWFCKNYAQYVRHEYDAPFDQHWLIAASAPRLVCVGSAAEDTWADPNSEYLSCVAAAPAWGENGFIHPDRLPQVGDMFNDGSIGYHLRANKHYLSRADWNAYMDFLDGKGWNA